MARTSTDAGHVGQARRGIAWTCSMSTPLARRIDTSRWIPPKFHQPPLPKPLNLAGRQWLRSVRARMDETRTTSRLVPGRRPVSGASNGR